MSDKTDPVELLLERRAAIAQDLKNARTTIADAVGRTARATEEATTYSKQITIINEALTKLGYIEPGQEPHAP